MSPTESDSDLEGAYLRTQLDDVAAENMQFRARARITQREIELRRRGFILLARLGRTLGAHTELEPAIAAALPIVEAELHVQRTVALRRQGSEYLPFAWTGFRGRESRALERARLIFPDSFEDDAGLAIAADDPEQGWLVRARQALGVPVFVAVPVGDRDHVLLTGRLAEHAEFFPRFDAVDLDTLKAVAGLLAAAVENTRLAALGEVKRFLPPSVVEELMSGRLVPQQGYARQVVTLLAADMVGFTTLADRLEADALADVLNAYLREMTTLANLHGGTIGSLAGDGVLVIFGAPELHTPAEQVWSSAQAAFAMQARMPTISEALPSEIGSVLQLRVGISTGSCAVGVFGSDSQRTYTAIGMPVNLAARLETAAAPGEVLVAPSTLALLGTRVRSHAREELTLKGIPAPVTAHSIRLAD